MSFPSRPTSPSVAGPSALRTRLARISHSMTFLAYMVALVVLIGSPLLAANWAQRPFPGFYVDPTLVINDVRTQSRGAVPFETGQVVTRIGGVDVGTSAEYARALAALSPGGETSVFVEDRDGTAHLVRPVRVTTAPTGELPYRFWLPYLAGGAYLAIGLWVFRTQGSTSSGRALALFCASTAVVTMLIFDLASTHFFTVVWTIAMSLEGATLISLALHFPRQWRSVEARPWLLPIPYAVSLLLALRGISALRDPNPWAYQGVWRAIYIYAAIGIVFFLGTSFVVSVKGETGTLRRQSRIVVWGSLLAFGPMTAWFLAPSFGLGFHFTPLLLYPPLVLFPLTIGVAIVRYRLWDIDLLVNRTLLYGVLTAFLAGLYSASIGLSQRLFVAFTGERSDAAIVITTLIVASALVPMRNRIQGFMERRLRDPLAELERLREFERAVNEFVEMTSVDRVAQRMVREVVDGLGAESGVLRVFEGPLADATLSVGAWRGAAWASIPLIREGNRLALLQLGPRIDRKPYTNREIETASQMLTQMAPVVLGSGAT